MRPVIVSFFFAGLIALSVWLGLTGLWTYKAAALSQIWPATPATIVGTPVDGIMRLRGGHYAYIVDGTLYKNRQTRFLVSAPAYALEKKRQFIEGETVTIYVHPEKPALSVIDRRSSGIGLTSLLAISALLFFTGAGGLWQVVGRLKAIPLQDTIA